MIEMKLLKKIEEIDKKIRWDAEIDGAPFKLYIPKWRAPNPWPKVIDVSIEIYNNQQPLTVSRDSARKVPELCQKPIFALFKKNVEKEHAIRYRPEGGRFSWEIGELYIPISLTLDRAENLFIRVQWQKRSH